MSQPLVSLSQGGLASSREQITLDSTTADEKQQDTYLCPFCKKFFNKPTKLHCGHHFCQNCLEIIHSFTILQSFEVCTSKLHLPGNSNEGAPLEHFFVKALACPICFQPTELEKQNAIAKLPISEELNEQSEKLRRVISDQKCGWCESNPGESECAKCEVVYCTQCKEETHKRLAFQNHEFYPLGDLEKQQFKTCDKHKGRRRDVFCFDCNRSLCAYCTKFEKHHDNHKLTSLPDAVSHFQKDIQTISNRYQSLHAHLVSYKESVEKSIQQLETGQEAVKNDIKNKLEDARQFLNSKERQFLEFVTARTNADLELANMINNSIERVQTFADSVTASLPENVQEPALLIEHQNQLNRLVQGLEDTQLETSLFPIRFDFDIDAFKAAFEESTTFIEQLDLGQVKSSVLSPSMFDALSFWLSKKISGKKECALIYRASVNGWSDARFQEIAAKITEPIIILCKAENDRVFGGFQTANWKKTNSFSGNDAFLFSFQQVDQNKLNSVLCENLHRDSKRGEFSARDFSFRLDSKLAASQLGHSFRLLPDGEESLFGSAQTKLVELEMFCIGNPQQRGPKLREILRGQPELKRALTNIIGQQFYGSNLLYKASRDGWFPAVFHEKCDNTAPNLTLIRSEHGHIFGAYNSQPWGGANIAFKGFITDPDAYLFSLTDGHGRPPLKLKTNNPKNSMQNDYKAGPCFGAGSDLRINLVEQTVNCSPFTFPIPTSYRQDTYLAGKAHARIEEIEVYRLAKQ